MMATGGSPDMGSAFTARWLRTRAIIIRSQHQQGSGRENGKRRFNVLVNGTQVLTNYDIYSHAGGSNIANVQAFTTPAGSDGRIVIQTQVGTVDGPIVQGIEIVGGSGTTVPAGEYKISGHVRLGGTGSSAGTAVPNATVTLSLGESDVTVTAADGSYSFLVYANGSYTITTSVPGYTVSSPITIYSVTANQANQDFTATLTAGGSLVPSSPSKEFIFVNGVPVVVEHNH